MDSGDSGMDSIDSRVDSWDSVDSGDFGLDSSASGGNIVDFGMDSGSLVWLRCTFWWVWCGILLILVFWCGFC